MTPGAWSFNRTWQGRALLFLSLLTLGLGVVGIYALHSAPALGFPSGFWFSPSEPEIRRIADLEVDATLSLRMPEFFRTRVEAAWWRMQDHVVARLQAQPSVSVLFLDSNGMLRTEEARVAALPLSVVFTRSWLIYLVASVCLGSALSVFYRHRSTEGAVLAFFLLACSVYFVSAAPLVCRSLTLEPGVFRLFVLTLHFATSSLCTFAHFALIFPEPKEIVQRHPWIVVLPYATALPATALYGVGIFAFGSTFPLLCGWVAVIVGLVLHSLFRARDPFLRKQLRLSLIAPVLVCLFFIGLYVVPGVLRLPPVDFRYFAVFFLIMPFALPLGMDNVALYHERVRTEQTAQQEKEQLRADLHDLILNNLAVISRSSEVARSHLDGAQEHLEKRLQSIQGLATTTSRQVREFLRVLDDRLGSWDALCSSLREWGGELLEDAGCDFDLEVAPAVLALPPPSLRLRICLDRIYKEAIHNVVKHARASRVDASFSCRGQTIVCRIHDDGVGFDVTAELDGHYGLGNIRRRAKEMAGNVAVESRPGGGTVLTVEIPVA